MLTILAEGARPLGELAALAGVAPSTAVFHVDQLERAGLAVRRRVGRRTFVHALPKTVQLVVTRSSPEDMLRHYLSE